MPQEMYNALKPSLTTNILNLLKVAARHQPRQDLKSQMNHRVIFFSQANKSVSSFSTNNLDSPTFNMPHN